MVCVFCMVWHTIVFTSHIAQSHDVTGRTHCFGGTQPILNWTPAAAAAINICWLLSNFPTHHLADIVLDIVLCKCS